MACSCDLDSVPFAVPASLRECVPVPTDGGDASDGGDARHASAAAAICPRCLAVEPAADGPADPDFSRVSEAFPSGEAGIALACCLGLLESLARHRDRIGDALAAVERGGADPLLAIDRLLADPDVEPAIDLERRRHQLEQLFY